MMKAVIFMAASVNKILESVRSHRRPNLASGISLYVSDDRKVATCVTPVASEFPDQDGAWVKLIKRPVVLYMKTLCKLPYY